MSQDRPRQNKALTEQGQRIAIQLALKEILDRNPSLVPVRQDGRWVVSNIHPDDVRPFKLLSAEHARKLGFKGSDEEGFQFYITAIQRLVHAAALGAEL